MTGALVVTGSSTGAALPVATMSRKALVTWSTEASTSRVLPGVPGTATALPVSNLIVPSVAVPAVEASSWSATWSFSSSTGMTASAVRSWPRSEPITVTGL